MKTSELTGAQLDYWVARAEGLTDPEFSEDQSYIFGDDAHGVVIRFSPSTDWSQGGPITERELITVTPQCVPNGPGDLLYWKVAQVIYGVFEDHAGRARAPKYLGKTYLIAAMRAYVASKFGDEVPDQISSL